MKFNEISRYCFVVFFLGVLVFENALGQEIIFEKEIDLRRGLTGKRESHPVINEANGELALFMFDNKTIRLHIFDSKLNIVDTIVGLKPNNYSNLLGSNQNESVINLFCTKSDDVILTGSSHVKFMVVSFDRKKRGVGYAEIVVDVVKERFIGAVDHLNKFYFFTVLKGSSKLKLYLFAEDKNYTTHLFDFNDKKFSDDPKETLFKLLDKPMLPVDNETPNPIDIASEKNKLYAFSDKIVFTFDNQLSETEMITIDANSLQYKFASYPKGKVQCASAVPSAKSNSYLYRDNLYQVVACNDGMLMSIIDMRNGEVINEYKVGREQEIDFKNSAIIQEGGASYYAQGNERELSKTKQFLRKITSSSAGISAYKTRQGMQVLVGGHKEMTGGGGGFGMAPSMGTGGAIQTPYGPVNTGWGYNPTYHGYNSYTATKSVYFKGLFDEKSFEHLEGQITENAFDRIKKFIDPIDELIVAETIFRKDGAFILGYYDKKKDTYVMRKFID
jgi:hypothetical protein